MELTVFHEFAIAVGLGLLVGLEREWAEKPIAGIRTFPLIAALGALCGLLAGPLGGWVVGAGLLAVAAMLWIGNAARLKSGKADAGLTTEVAALVMYAVGAVVVIGHVALAVVAGGTVSLLLHWKRPLHTLVQRIGADDFRALVRLVLVGMVILPVLPDKAYGPYGVLNPFRIWLMVVLIVGISLCAYAAQRALGARTGTLLSGVLGGLISSTATAVGYARRSRETPAASSAAAVVIVLASAVVFGRVLFEIAVVAPGILRQVGAPLGVMMLFVALLGGVLFVFARPAGGKNDVPAPSDLKAAIVFGLLYAVVLFGVAAAKEQFGDRGLYVVAALSGLTDMDAITLSTAQLIKSGDLEVSVGWRLILVGAMANLVFKAAAIAVLGHRRLLGRIAVLFALALACGTVLLLWWPG